MNADTKSEYVCSALVTWEVFFLGWKCSARCCCCCYTETDRFVLLSLHTKLSLLSSMAPPPVLSPPSSLSCSSSSSLSTPKLFLPGSEGATRVGTNLRLCSMNDRTQVPSHCQINTRFWGPRCLVSFSTIFVHSEAQSRTNSHSFSDRFDEHGPDLCSDGQNSNSPPSPSFQAFFFYWQFDPRGGFL